MASKKILQYQLSQNAQFFFFKKKKCFKAELRQHVNHQYSSNHKPQKNPKNKIAYPFAFDVSSVTKFGFGRTPNR